MPELLSDEPTITIRLDHYLRLRGRAESVVTEFIPYLPKSLTKNFRWWWRGLAAHIDDLSEVLDEFDPERDRNEKWINQRRDGRENRRNEKYA